MTTIGQATASIQYGAAIAPSSAGNDGGPLSDVQLAQVFYQAGFRGDNLVCMVAIAKRESGGDPSVCNDNAGTRDLSYGLVQINMIGSLGVARREQLGLASNDELLDPLTNARAAFAISGNGTDLGPWGGYRGVSNTFNTDLPAARAAVEQAEAQGLLGQPFEDGAAQPQAAAPAAAATFAPTAAAHPVLRIGARGEDVKTLQRQLIAAGFDPGPVDGSFGPRTQAAVRAFQQSRGITVDGWVGPQTWGRLDAVAAGGAAGGGRLVQGSSGAQVRELQQMLQSLGYYHGNIGGNFGPQTDAAVRAFQRDHGLAVDGWAGPQTMAALRQATPGGAQPAAPATPVAPGTSASGDARLDAALDFGVSQLGAPYVGGGSPFRFGDPGNGRTYQMDGQRAYVSPLGVRGYDCSGLVVAMFRQAGVDLAAQNIANTSQMAARLPAVSRQDLRPGDLLVNAGHHVVIYLGDRDGDGRPEVLEATPPTVTISDADKFLNNPAYVGRRVPLG